MNSNASKRAVLFMGPFPPPVHGASVVTAALADKVEEVVPIIRINLAPPLRSGIRYHLGRVVCHIEAAGRVLKERNNARVAYLSLPGGFGMVYVIPILALARGLRYEIFLHHHSYAYIRTRNRLADLAFRVAGKNHRSIVLSDGMGEDLRQRYRSVRNTQTLSNAWSIKDGESRVPGLTSGKVIGHLSNLCLEKGIDTVIDVFNHLAWLDKGYTLRIAGPFADDQAKAIVEKVIKKHPGRVMYEGPLYSDEKDAFFRKIDVFLFPSRYANEAEPLVLDEALAGGAAIVATRIGCTNERTFLNSSAELLVAGASPQEFVRALAKLSADESLTTNVRDARAHRVHSARGGLELFCGQFIAPPLAPTGRVNEE